MNNTGRGLRTLLKPARICLITATLLVLLLLANYSLRRRTSFDGSMNLQVAWSLAEGDGYRRPYGDRIYFPQEVQTNAPFLVPAAAVFSLFGIGTAQAQLVNLAYLCGLAVLTFLLLRRRYANLSPGVGALLIVTTPGILLEGMNGYGEIVGLLWALASLLVYPWEGGRRGPRMLLSGACLGLAVCTKTVMLICAASFGFLFVIFALTESERYRSERLGHACLLLVGFLLPVTGIELWKLISFGGWVPYRSWWLDQYYAVARQAGIMEGYRDTQGYLSKISVHLRHLSGFYGLPVPALLGWLAAPLVLLWLVIPKRIRRRDGVLWCVLLAIAVYFLWWLLITPTEKAWHRRILIGSLLLNLSWVYVSALVTGSWKTRTGNRLSYLPMTACVFLAIHFFSVDAGNLRRGPDSQPDVDQAIELLKRLPPEARICGIGWYSAPTLSLFSGRPFQDFNDLVLRDLDRSRPTYLVLDHSAVVMEKADPITSTYRARELLPEAQRVQIYEVDLSSLDPEVMGEHAVTVGPTADLTTDEYPFVWGFSRAERSGSRWMSSEGLVSLKYNGEPELAVRLYVPRPNLFVRPGRIALSASLEGCGLGEVEFDKAGIKTVRFTIPETCRPSPMDQVTVRISSDNLIQSPVAKDDRSMSVMVMSIGFQNP